MEVPKLKRMVRLDSLPMGQTYYTPEGYLVDRPILTSTGIFEYHNEDGSIRRELRLPEEVFSPESLKSYKGRPVIITHDAGLVTKENVHHYQVGTILSEGYRDGDDVRAEIVIHDTDEMKRCGLKELSLGYNLDLDETPGVWNGQPYDAVQRNIRINHLALVREARAGDQARLNIDSRDTIKGGKMDMNKRTPKKTPKKARRADGVLSREELEAAIAQYKQSRAKRGAPAAAVADADEPTKEVVSTVPENKPAAVADADEPATTQEPATVEEKVQAVKDRKDRRDQEGDPETFEDAKKTITNQDEDMDLLFDIIDTLLAERDFDSAKCDEGEEKPEDAAVVADEDDPNATDKENADEDEDPIPSADETMLADGDEATEEEAPSKPVKVNADSIDAIVRDRVNILRVGDQLNLDGLDTMSVRAAKCTIIKAVTPGLRLDGKSPAYINALFDRAVADVNARSRKDIGYQKRQMFNQDSRNIPARADSADAARQRMIDRRTNRKETK